MHPVALQRSKRKHQQMAMDAGVGHPLGGGGGGGGVGGGGGANMEQAQIAMAMRNSQYDQ